MGIVHKDKHKALAVEDLKGNGWWKRFMERWPQLALRTGDALAQPHANVVNSENMKQYYAKY